MLRTVFLTLAVALPFVASSAVAEEHQSSLKPLSFTEYDLANGLHVILHENHASPVVATYLLYHVGSKNERSDRTGFAHFFEHLMFEGSDNIPRGKIDKYVSGAGGNLNASTSFDQTDYFFNLPSNELKLALWIESERMMHAKVDETGVETQRKVVKEEKRMRYDNQPYGSLFEELAQFVFAGTPYAFRSFEKTDGYANLPLDGLWLRGPYLHNGAVPTLKDLLAPPTERPSAYLRGSDVIDAVNGGFLSPPCDPKAPPSAAGFCFDTAQAGNGRDGHLYGTDLPASAKSDLLAYLLTF